MNTDTQQILALAENAIQHCTILERLFEEEFKALSNRDSQNIQSLQERKQGHLDALARFDTQRGTLLNQLGFTSSQDGWKQWLKQSSLSEEQLSSCSKLEESLKNCQQLNARNGKSIARHQQTLARLLNILRGQPVEGSMLYNHKGRTASEQSKLPSISA